ncbi:NAD(P)H-dependent oxidoreductase [Niabella terrae]
MRTVIVFNHPYEDSFCHAILQAVSSGLTRTDQPMDLIHLDRDGFNPVMTSRDLKAFKAQKPVDPQVIAYKERLNKAEHLVLIFPVWWELMPALTKGFIDRVIFPGVAYEHSPDGRRMIPLFKGMKRITLITTMNSPRLMYRFLFGNAVKKAVLTGTFWKMGYRNLKWMNLSMVKFVTDKKRQKWLRRLEHKFSTYRSA